MRSHLINFYCQYHFCALKYSSKITLFRNYKNISIGSGFYLYEDYDFQPNLSWQFPFSFWLIPTTFYWTGFGSLPHGTPSQWGQHGKQLSILSFLYRCTTKTDGHVTPSMFLHPVIIFKAQRELISFQPPVGPAHILIYLAHPFTMDFPRETTM